MKRQSLLELAISGRHRDHYLWLLTQSYSAMPKNLRRQAKAIFVWYPKERADLKMIHDENDALTDDEFVIVRDFEGCQNMHVYEMNIPENLRYWAMYEAIIFLSEPIDPLNAVIHPSLFVTVRTLVEYSCSFICRTDLFSRGIYVVFSTLKTNV